MLGNKLLNIQFAKYHIWNKKRETSNQSVRKNWSEGFPNMVLSTEYSEAVNARSTFQPLWVSDTTKLLRTVPTNSRVFLRGLLTMREKQILTSVIEIKKQSWG